MSGLADAVKNGPRMQQARSAKIAAEIEECQAEAAAAKHIASEHRRKGQGDGAMAWYHRGAANRWDAEAAKLTKRANALRVELVKTKADETAKREKHVKRTVASTRDEFGTGPASGGQRPGQVANPGRPGPLPPKCPDPKTAIPAPTKGPTMPAITGEAVNIEQARASLDQLKTQVADLRASFEGMSGSLASGGLNKLAGSLATADDALESVTTQIEAAEKQLADQEAIAEAAQAAGEMHTDTSFYA